MYARITELKDEGTSAGVKNPGFATYHHHFTEDFIKAMTIAFKKWQLKQAFAQAIQTVRQRHDKETKDILKRYGRK